MYSSFVFTSFLLFGATKKAPTTPGVVKRHRFRRCLHRHRTSTRLAVRAVGSQGRDPEQAIRRVLDLEGRVVEPEPLVEELFELAADAMAVLVARHEHVRRQ